MSLTVAIERCSSYEIPQVEEAVQNAFAPFGGLEAHIKRGDRTLLKPNLLYAKPPEKAVTTHPAIVDVVARMAMDCGAKVIIGDSPPLPSARRVARACGIADVADRLGIEIVEFRRPTNKSRKETIYTNGVPTPMLDASLLECDVIINLPKLKSHCQMRLTGAVKNLFGCVNGRRKALWHFKKRMSPDSFASMLLAILEKTGPELTLVDAITGMEGEGPVIGVPRHVGLLLAGQDAVAVDRALAELLGMNWQDHFVLRMADRLGFPGSKLDAIHITGLPLNEARVDGYIFPDLMPIGFSISHLIKGLWRHFVQKWKGDRSTRPC